VIAAGTGGQILTSADGNDFYYQGADVPNALRDWKAVDMADGANAAVAGASGALVVTAAADSVPAPPSPPAGPGPGPGGGGRG
jgi:photosystem II stability/assembly factor-like uncharacterized protein